MNQQSGKRRLIVEASYLKTQEGRISKVREAHDRAEARDMMNAAEYTPLHHPSPSHAFL
jgi:uracil-DNA glycosylase